MLVLVLKEDEPLRLTHPDGTEIVLHGTVIRDGRMKLAIDAPLSVTILRDGARDREPVSRVGRPTAFRHGGRRDAPPAPPGG